MPAAGFSRSSRGAVSAGFLRVDHASRQLSSIRLVPCGTARPYQFIVWQGDHVAPVHGLDDEKAVIIAVRGEVRWSERTLKILKSAAFACPLLATAGCPGCQSASVFCAADLVS